MVPSLKTKSRRVENSLAFLSELKHSTERNAGGQGQRRMTSGLLFSGLRSKLSTSQSIHLCTQFFSSKGKLYLTFKSRAGRFWLFHQRRLQSSLDRSRILKSKGQKLLNLGRDYNQSGQDVKGQVYTAGCPAQNGFDVQVAE